ncbi:MAG: hypothetical protein IJ193_03910, partial [Bacilli bacterium]|nr:hypothetical protein [Bacilli bacterium]
FIGEIYNSYHTYSIITTNILTFLMSIIKVIGYSSLIGIFYYYIDHYIHKIKFVRNYHFHNKWIDRYVTYFDEHPFRSSFLTILLVWSIYFIAFYPGVLSPDPYFQLLQYFNVPNKYVDWVNQIDPMVFMTTHHPVFHTFLIGGCVSIGRLILNDSFGIFLYTLLQTLFYSSVLSYTILFLKRHKINKVYRFILLLIYLFVPCYGFYTVSLVKDVYYTAFMILFVLYVYDLVEKNNLMHTKNIFIYALLLLMPCLFRHNGVIVVVLTTIALMIYSKVNRYRLLSSLCIFGIVFFSFNHLLIPALGISKGSSREMFSVPFQQTARYVKYYGSELNDADRKAIDKVLGYDTLSHRYNPESADPVKNKFNKDVTSKELKDYFKVWMKGFKKHPGVYIDSFINNTYGYYYPNKHNWYLYSNHLEDYMNSGVFEYKINDLSILRGILVGYGNLFPFIPGIGLFVNIGFNTLFMIVLSTYLFTKKNWKYLIVFLPLYLSFGICLVSPVNTYFRYTMPYLFILPTLTCLLRDKITISS